MSKESQLKIEKNSESNDLICNSISLPFPLPIRNEEGDVIWMCKEPGWIQFVGKINRDEKCIEIDDNSSAIAIYSMGYFGDANWIHKKKRLNSITEVKPTNIEVMNQLPQKEKYYLNSFVLPDLNDVKVKTINQEFVPQFDFLNNRTNESQDKPSLKLMLTEAFFLSYCLGCLNINNDGHLLNIDEIWKCFCLIYDKNEFRFPILYGAYHYFRSKGWIVKSGHKYGCDMLLYKEGPPFYHALYCVTVIQDGLNQDSNSTLSWHYLSGAVRLTHNVKKEMLICYVCVPDTFNKDNLKSPKCIEQFVIKLMHFDRWIPSNKTSN